MNCRKSSHSNPSGAFVEAASWRKSSHSNPSGCCVEAGQGAGVIGIRDSADPHSPVLEVSPAAWTAFTGSLK